MLLCNTAGTFFKKEVILFEGVRSHGRRSNRPHSISSSSERSKSTGPNSYKISRKGQGISSLI
jgi:hypothetical protein